MGCKSQQNNNNPKVKRTAIAFKDKTPQGSETLAAPQPSTKYRGSLPCRQEISRLRVKKKTADAVVQTTVPPSPHRRWIIRSPLQLLAKLLPDIPEKWLPSEGNPVRKNTKDTLLFCKLGDYPIPPPPPSPDKVLKTSQPVRLNKPELKFQTTQSAQRFCDLFEQSC